VTDEREEIRDTLRALALGEVEASGREVAARVSAVRRWEMLTRPQHHEPLESEDASATLDYPVRPDGKFDPGCQPGFWKVDLAFRWEAGSEREAEAIARWLKDPDGQRRWIREGRPFARSRWEVDRSEWRAALADLD
jgi:hypothetical protein